MAKIVKSESGYWVGKELYPNESYISGDEIWFYHPAEKIVPVDFDELVADISSHLMVLVTVNTPELILKFIAKQLCSDKLGMLYLLDCKSPFGVRKVIDAPDQFSNT